MSGELVGVVVGAVLGFLLSQFGSIGTWILNKIRMKDSLYAEIENLNLKADQAIRTCDETFENISDGTFYFLKLPSRFRVHMVETIYPEVFLSLSPAERTAFDAIYGYVDNYNKNCDEMPSKTPEQRLMKAAQLKSYAIRLSLTADDLYKHGKHNRTYTKDDPFFEELTNRVMSIQGDVDQAHTKGSQFSGFTSNS